MTEGDNCG